ncbi:MAG: ABC transporter substrate-binding protein [Pseudomonadota bacterium]|jgi:ABC-type branched-subunit amino acid transport system substrate-binding protein
MRRNFNISEALLPKVLLSLSIAFIWLVAPSQSQSEPPQRIKVGVIVGLTGIAASNGNDLVNGISLADANSDVSNLVEFIIQDDNFQPKHTVSAAQKLISEDKVAALITFSGSTSLAASTITESRGIAHVAITPLTRVSANKRFVRTVFVPNETAIALLKEAISGFTHGRIAIITSTQDALLEIREEIRASCGTKVVFDEELQPGNVDLLSTVTRLLTSKPDLVVNLTLPPQISLVARILRDHHFTGKQVGAPPMYNLSEIKAATGALTGAYLTGPRIAAGSPFLADYKARFNTPPLPEAILGYDVASWMIEAAKDARGLSSLLSARTQTGLAGEYRMSSENQFEVPGELKVVTADGGVKAYDKELACCAALHEKQLKTNQNLDLQ